MSKVFQQRYHIQVDRGVEPFQKDMDYRTCSPKKAAKHYVKVRTKYPSNDIKITRTEITIQSEIISQSLLEKIAKEEAEA